MMSTAPTPPLALAAVFLSLSLPGCAPSVDEGAEDAAAEPYHILVSNDDGITSPGIQELADALRGVGDVTVIAPCGQRSGSSMAVDLRQEMRLMPYEVDGEARGHCVDASPAGAVLLAIEALAPEGGFDLVVSGINAGANVGDLSHMSGTVGAAMMGAYYGIPAVAASLGDARDFGYAAAFTARFVEEVRRRPPLPGVVLSVNIPRTTETGTEGVAVAPMGGSYLVFGYEEGDPEEGARVFRPRLALEDSHPPGTDSEAYTAGMITITPLRFDWTDDELVRELASWGLDHRVGGRP